MTRWHESNCASPDVYVYDANTPACRTCLHVCPSATTLMAIADLEKTSSGINIPQDEPRGQMNLWWPRDVLYVNQKPGIDRSSMPPKADNAEYKAYKPDQSSRPPKVKHSEYKTHEPGVETSVNQLSSPGIYGETLAGNEFRLVCLEAPPAKDYPVRLSLETYTYDNRPEYEPVSYMWGGENGDSTPCQPVFVGPYWDVLLQSQNCWAMLKFVRPWRGVRMIWVDAICTFFQVFAKWRPEYRPWHVCLWSALSAYCICLVKYTNFLGINQRNLTERASQVARMRQIYGEGSRVIVYLGDDVVTDPGQFPTHLNLDDIDAAPSYGDLIPTRDERASTGPLPKTHLRSKETSNLAKLLSRAYFSRVWVGDVSPCGTCICADLLFQVIQELIASDRAMLRVGNFEFKADVAALSRMSQKYKDSFRWSQTRAPWVQYLGQKAINPNRAKDIVSLAALTSNCRATDPRDRIFAIVQLLVEERLRTSLSPNYTLSFQHFSIGFFAHALLVAQKTFFFDHAGLLKSLSAPSWVPHCRSDTAWQQVFRYAIPRYEERSYSTLNCQVYIDSRCQVAIGEVCSINKDRPKYIKPAVDSATGALVLDLTHLFVFDQQPVLMGTSSSKFHVYEVVQRTPHEPLKRLCFFSWTLLSIEEGDHLFALPTDGPPEPRRPYNTGAPAAVLRNDNQESTGMMYLVLRPRPSEYGLHTFQLVTTRLGLCAQTPYLLDDLESGLFTANDWPEIRNVGYLKLSQVQISIASALNSVVKMLSDARDTLSRGRWSWNTSLPTGYDAASRKSAAEICEAFYVNETGEQLNHLANTIVKDTRIAHRDKLLYIEELVGFLNRNNMRALLGAIRHSYKYSQSIQDVACWIRDGPTDAQRAIGVTKYINGVKVDGSVVRVLIV